MSEDRSVEGTGAAWVPQRPTIDLPRLSSTLAAGAQRARLLVSGVAGPLSDRQRSLALDLLRDLEQLCDAAGLAARPTRIEPETIELAPLVADVIGSLRFVAHRRHLLVALLGGSLPTHCHADPEVVRATLSDALGAALLAAPGGGRVTVEIARSADRLAVDVSAPGWDPRLPPAPPSGSGIAVSVLRTASGARLVLSVLAVPTRTGAQTPG